MNVGKTLFAQVMEFLPWTTFRRIVSRYEGDHRARTLFCTDQFRCMAFAQLTYRESLRDIEACLGAQAGKLYHIGLRQPVRRSTLAEANESRDWRIYAEFAQRLITRARELYAADSFGLELSDTVYALDATTIDLCLAMFPWAPFRSTKAAIKLHTLLDLRGAIPSFIDISDGKVHDVNVLDLLIPEPGAFYVMDRGYVDFERLYALSQAGAFFVTRAKKNMDARPIPADQLQRSRIGEEACLSHEPISAPSVDRLRALQVPLAGGTVFQVDQATSPNQAILWHFRERREDANLDCGLRLRAHRHHQKAAQPRRFTPHTSTDPVAHTLRKTRSRRGTYTTFARNQNHRHI